MKINIFGSCCTRELFNYQSKHEVGCYVMQQSLFTLYAKPLEITLDEAKGTDDSLFKKRMMYYEFNKLGLKKILETPADFLVVDFADCRYDIYTFTKPEGVKIIYTHEARATFDNIKDIDRFKDIEKEYCNIEETYSDEDLEKLVTRFANDILSVYKPEQVILNRIQMNDKYYIEGKEEQLENNFHYGKRHFIKKIEDLFLKAMPGCRELCTKELPILNINHRFGGPHPLHYEDIYYKYKMDILDCLFENKDIKEAEEEYKKVYDTEIETIRLKRKDDKSNVSSARRVD